MSGNFGYAIVTSSAVGLAFASKKQDVDAEPQCINFIRDNFFSNGFYISLWVLNI